jgi:hypothetical protein
LGRDETLGPQLHGPLLEPVWVHPDALTLAPCKEIAQNAPDFAGKQFKWKSEILFYINKLSGGCAGRLRRTCLGQPNFPDLRENTGNFIAIALIV